MRDHKAAAAAAAAAVAALALAAGPADAHCWFNCENLVFEDQFEELDVGLWKHGG